MSSNKSLFLDSGAFSAWTKGVQIDIDEYIQFCLEHLDILDVIANLDIIPGKPGKRSTQEDIEQSAEKGWANYQKMLREGIPKEKLVHIFHQGENFKWLRRMVERIPYIGLSPANDKTTTQKIRWLDQCMEYVTDKTGMPKVKFHGFGVNTIRLLLRYPWFSVDSSSWTITSGMGAIFVPHYAAGEWVYDKTPQRILVSLRNSHHKEAGKHINTFPPRQRQLILDYISSKGFRLGKSHFEKVPQDHMCAKNEHWIEKKPKDPTAFRELEVIEEEGVTNSERHRKEIVLAFFVDLEKTLPKWPWPFQREKIRGFL